jgi:hypothetical protein
MLSLTVAVTSLLGVIPLRSKSWMLLFSIVTNSPEVLFSAQIPVPVPESSWSEW